MLSSVGPPAHDFGSQPVSSGFCFLGNGHAVESAKWISTAGEQERGDVSVERTAGLDLAVMFNVNGVAQQGPSVTVVVLDVMASVEKVTQVR